MNLKIKDIIKETEGKLIIGDPEKECENFSIDTRTIKNGDVYVGIKGETIDGNEFWKEALENGAETLVIQNNANFSEEEAKKYKEKNIIMVKDTQKALIEIAKKKREMYKDLIVVGVTGSVGKTSTKDIIASVLSQKYKTLKTQGNYNNSIGVPLTILSLKDHEVAVVEMGMNHLGEISELTQIAKPTFAVITNIGTAHIGNLGSRENILKAKLEIIEGMKNPTVIINNDNDMLNNWAKNNNDEKIQNQIKIYKFGIENKSDCMAIDMKKSENSSEFIALIEEDDLKHLKKEEIKIKVPIGGEVFILNALCAILAGKILDLSNDQISKGISTFELTKKRMEIIKLKNGVTLINDSYNASFDSMKAAIQYLSETNSNRKIAVLGDMFELGEYTEKLHREVGKEISKNKIDFLYTIGEASKYIKDEAIKNGIDVSKTMHTNTTDELIEEIKKNMKTGDTILFKASNGMKLFDVVKKIIC